MRFILIFLKLFLFLLVNAIIIASNHSNFDYGMIQKNAQLIVDIRNAIKGKYENVLKLGAI